MTTSVMFGQAFEKKFQGHWGASNWIFEFNTDGTFERIEQYHFGERRTQGKYTVIGTKIHIVVHAENNDSPVTLYYLLDDENNYLIEVATAYDYKAVIEGVYSDYTSKKRKIGTS